ncbi:hypothetical protein [Bradyrhizobium cenepequi]
MITKASGLLAVLVAAGLFTCVAAPSPVEAAGSGSATASDSDTATSVKKQGTRHGKRDKSAKTESKSSESKSSESKSSETKRPDSAEGVAPPTTLPASVANAKAELTPNVPADNANAMSAKANTLLAASDKPDEAKAPGDGDVVASDQLNEVDRALQESQPQNQPAAQPQQPVPAVAMTTAQAPTTPVASADNSTWDRTSLIGKIFIAAGALLTMASAARMFLA